MLAPAYDLNITKSTRISYGYYVNYHGRLNFHRFAALYAAKKFLEIVIDGDDYTWDTFSPAKGVPSVPVLVTSRGLTIRGYGLEEALEHEYTKEEEAFRFDALDEGLYARIPHDGPQGTPRGTQDTPPTVVAPEDSAKASRREAKAPRAPSAPRPTKVKVVEGLTTIAQIAADLGMEPRVARGILRDNNTPKPASGNWAWADPTPIIALLKGAKK